MQKWAEGMRLDGVCPNMHVESETIDSTTMQFFSLKGLCELTNKACIKFPACFADLNRAYDHVAKLLA